MKRVREPAETHVITPSQRFPRGGRLTRTWQSESGLGWKCAHGDEREKRNKRYEHQNH